MRVLGHNDRRAGLVLPLRCAPMTHDPLHEAEITTIVAELEQAGLVEVTTDEQGREVWTPRASASATCSRWSLTRTSG